MLRLKRPENKKRSPSSLWRARRRLNAQRSKFGLLQLLLALPSLPTLSEEVLDILKQNRWLLESSEMSSFLVLTVEDEVRNLLQPSLGRAHNLLGEGGEAVRFDNIRIGPLQSARSSIL